MSLLLKGSSFNIGGIKPRQDELAEPLQPSCFSKLSEKYAG